MTWLAAASSACKLYVTITGRPATGRTAAHMSAQGLPTSLSVITLYACLCVCVWRPLHCAVAGNHVTIVRELLRCGADVTKLNGSKRSVLQLAKGRAVRQLIHGKLMYTRCHRRIYHWATWAMPLNCEKISRMAKNATKCAIFRQKSQKISAVDSPLPRLYPHCGGKYP